MATANPSSPNRLPSRLALLFTILLVGVLAWFWGPITDYARAGSAYGARVACSCRYVGGRSLGDCRKDFEPGMSLFMLSEDSASKSVTVRLPLFASDTATFREGEGCRLAPWRK